MCQHLRGFGVHEVFSAFFCCGGPLCLRWWCGPDFIFDGANQITNSEVKDSPWRDIIEEEWGWNVDTMLYIDFTKVINSLRYKSFKCLWYRDPRKALCRGLKPLNCDYDILQLTEDVSGFDVVEVYVDEGGDEVVVIDGVEVEAVVEGEDEAEIQVEDEVQVHEQGLVEVQVQAEDEASVVGEMAIVVEGVVEDDVGAEEDDDDSSDCRSKIF
ncbi:hypothetical protein GmHk_18G052422 [Glycine max]|nr:hypothetical protein GmHk_18G052422 [Glycine max]